MTHYDLAFYQRLREEYEARWGEPGFDEQKLLAMIGGCAAAVILGVTEAAASAALRHGSGALGFDGPDRIWPAMGFGRLQ